MSCNIDINLILQKIKELESESSNNRKLVKNDFTKNVKIKKNKKQIKVKDNRIQGEYGEKKFIKPWRTGTKSQQQPPRSGKKAGGRGVQRT